MTTTLFEEAYDNLEQWAWEAVENATVFWASSGVPKCSKPNIALASIFLQPANWSSWALVMTGGDARLLGSFVARGVVTEMFVRITKTHIILHGTPVGTALSSEKTSEIVDKLLRHFLPIGVTFVQGCALNVPVEDTAFLLLDAVRAARNDIVAVFKGALKPQHLNTQAIKERRVLLFGKSGRGHDSSSSSEDDDGPVVDDGGSATKSGIPRKRSQGSRQRKRTRDSETSRLLMAADTGKPKVDGANALAAFDNKRPNAAPVKRVQKKGKAPVKKAAGKATKKQATAVAPMKKRPPAAKKKKDR